MKLRTMVVQSCAALTVSCATHEVLLPAEPGTAVTIPASARCNWSPSFPAAQNCCVMAPYLTGSPVDRSYAAVVAEYRFSPRPAPYDLEAEAVPNVPRGHAHEYLAGDHYQLGGIVVPRNSPELFRGVWLGLTLKAEPHNLTEVRPVYCEVGGRAMVQQSAWHRTVQESILSTLPPQAGRP